LTHPICLKGKRACPPEDIGGIYGYMHIVHMLNSTDADEEVEQFIEWYGGEYDPEYFNVEEVNERLKSIQL
jgi:Plasmid pRiA4b ORF-3-like protein